MAKHSILETLSDSLRKDTLAGLSTHRFPAGQILFSAGGCHWCLMAASRCR